MQSITEKRLLAVSPQSFITDGSSLGLVVIANSTLFRVGQIVAVKSSAQDSQLFKINRILGTTELYLGPLKGRIETRADVSSYLVADGATVSATEQQRPSIPEQEVERITYEEEPTVARRVVIVDPVGARIDDDNPLPITGNITTSAKLAKTPTIYNITAVLAGTQYSQLFPANMLQFKLRARNNAKLQIAYTTGETSTNFYTLMPGNVYDMVDIDTTFGTTIYFEATKADTVVEIEVWT